MANPQIIESEPLSLVDVREILEEIEKRDKELNYLPNKGKEYIDQFVKLTLDQKKELVKKLVDIKLTRLKEEHIAKIVDFLPQNDDELKAVLQGFHLNMPKKDIDSVLKIVAEFIPK